MKFPKTVKPELCASEDQTRMSIVHPWTVKAGDETYLVATDGRKMVRFPVTLEEGEEPGPVPCKAFELARKECNSRNREASIHANGVITLSSGATLPRPEGFTPPNYAQVWPAKDRPVNFKVCLDAELLVEMQKAAGAKGCLLEFEDAEGCIKVRFSSPAIPGTEGLLMPMRLF